MKKDHRQGKTNAKNQTSNEKTRYTGDKKLGGPNRPAE
ncbi:spore protein [Shouchella tritolerans]|nr:spore protein [Shouchella tritolerans]